MVKEGYKETEMGLIPELWSVNSLHEHLLLLTDYDANGSFADMANNVKTTWGNGFAWFVRATDLEQKSEMSVVKYTDKTSYEFLKKSALFGKELLVAKRGEIGKVYYFQMKTQYATLGPNLYLLKLKETLNSNFLYWFFLSEIGQEKLKEINASTSLGAIYKDDVKKLKVPIPPLCEQEKIAEALSDMDSLISSFEKLIEKKKAVKQGAMQELLTGKKRLSGFSGAWNEFCIGKIGEFYGGLSGKTKNDFNCGNAHYITFLNVLSNVKIDTSILASVNVKETENQNAVKKGDLFFNTSSETPEEVGMCAVLDEEIENTYLNSFCFGFRMKNNEHNPIFLSYYLNSSIGRKIMSTLAQGATRYNLSKNNFAETIIELPTKEEQTAIASILSDMDAEITALEQKLEKCQKLKQGMMQQLLTGKIRLV